MEHKDIHTALEVKDLHIGYFTKKQATVVAQGLNFRISHGEMVSIVGKNGIGKSTLLRSIANMQPIVAGEININNLPLREYNSMSLASVISIVLTDALATKNLTVLELIALGRQPYTNWLGTLTEADKKKVNEAVHLVDLDALKHKKCYELSDGQLQRVMIARALAQDTMIILLDEPTAHLDLYHKVQILKLLRSIAHQTGKTILFTSHEIDMVIQMCDKILLMNQERHEFGGPQFLVQQKSFEKLFPSDTIRFDGTSGSFKIQM